jgi:hypothetical protein
VRAGKEPDSSQNSSCSQRKKEAEFGPAVTLMVEGGESNEGTETLL